MDAKEGQKKNYLTFGSIISFMLDYNDSNDYPTIYYDPKNYNADMIKNKEHYEYLSTRNFLFSHGVFNDYCFFYQFKNQQDLKNNFLNTAFLVLPSFEYDSKESLNKMIKKIKQAGITKILDNGITEQQINDNYLRFKQEILTSHEKSIKLMDRDNNTVHYNECIQFLHLKSGKFLEYKLNNKNFKTYIQLSNNMSKRTLFRFMPAYDYQSETSVHCLFDLAIKIACGEKETKKEKYIVNENIYGVEKNFLIKNNSILGNASGEDEDEKNDIIKNDITQKKSIFECENLKNTVKAIYNDENQDLKIIDEFVTYSMNEIYNKKN